MSNHKTISIILIGVALIGGYFLLRDTMSERKTLTPQTPPATLESKAQTNTVDVVSVKNTQGYYDIESSVLIQMLKNKNFSLVNVHIPYAGELANTDTFIPYDAIRQNLGNLPTDKNAKIVLYCRSGSMSAAAAKELATLGYTNVYNLAGGMNEWEKEGNAIIRK